MAPLTDISRAFGQHSAAEPISRTMQYRKITKPLLERQRRARINRCLDELKDILVAGLQNEGENVARLEKADILELTVRYLHKLTEQTKSAAAASAAAAASSAPHHHHQNGGIIGEDEKFRVGYATCVQEISRILASTKVDVHVGSSLMMHLGHALNQISSVLPSSSSSSSSPFLTRPSSPISSSSSTVSMSSPRPNSSCSPDYRPYTPPASPQSSEVSSSALSSRSRSTDKNVWRPW